MPDLFDAICETIQPFSEHELGVVLFLARRLAHGREIYGPLNPNDGRNWTDEEAEELADSIVYRYAALVAAGGVL